MNDVRCLMVETPDKRKFFTYEANYPSLIEFSKTFGAAISVVQVQEGEILDLDKLAPAICDMNYNQISDFQVIETKIQGKVKKCRKTAKDIKDYIRSLFVAGKPVSLKEISEHFSHTNLTKSCFCNYISQIRNTLQKQGINVNKTKCGEYQVFLLNN